MDRDTELLTGLSQGELEALSETRLAPSAQAHLDALLARNQENHLSAEEQAELDHLLTRGDCLTLLKTRARYTLQRQAAGAAGS